MTAGRATGPAPEIRLDGITKSFGSHMALHPIDLRLEPGRVVGLMGPNGAGKSTLIKILDGIHSPDRGEIRLGATVVGSLAGRPEVAFIHQDLGLVDDLTVLQNLRLGQPPLRRAGLLDRARETAAAQRALAAVSVDLPVETPVGRLAPGERTLVAIARAFDRGATVLFVDEATSTLPPGEAKRVLDSLKVKAAEGATVVMVTHKLSEILDAADRVVVLIDGRVVEDAPSAALDRAALVRMLVRSESPAAAVEDAALTPGDTLVELDGAVGGAVGPVTLRLRRHEAVGVTGLTGSGLHDLAHLVHGSTPLAAGRMSIAPGVRRALVPPNRETQGGFDRLSVRENLTLGALDRLRGRSGLLDLRAERSTAGSSVERLSIAPPDPEARYGSLSGGNKQKVILGRLLLQRPDVFVLCEPTRGVDMTTREQIYAIVRTLTREGAAILVVTSDAEDLFAVCDRIGVVADGRLSPLRPVSEMAESELESVV
ncbi:ATP-binding cassette domain-containing protein [Pseudonocardia pini]|uniref:ATP-binding cassette domain-containing protein n=1 Tax=Pseudonocardia pini TaxID=2758030 RepID=UPI0015F0FE2C|nr:sugar ABC transporter ATP-binding protein [Pseudonocardia pini]